MDAWRGAADGVGVGVVLQWKAGRARGVRGAQPPGVYKGGARAQPPQCK